MQVSNICRKFIFSAACLLSLLHRQNLFAGQIGQAEEKIIGEEVAVLSDAPSAGSPITRTHATKVIVHLEAKEVQGRLADGVQYTFWTFGGKVPGKFIRIREGDLVEFHLNNHPNNKMPHNIDLHAVIGPGGGAPASLAAPGHSSVFSFKAQKPGLFVYHCATAPVVMHIANGMYGMILVEPKEGLPKVDREYYIMQGDFYTKGSYGQKGHQPFSMEKATEERPDYVLFNGSVGSLTGDSSLVANVGENVRLFIGNGGPNLMSSFHVIGEIFDQVWTEGNSNLVANNVQTTVIPSGGAAIVQFKAQAPGEFALVDHALSRAFSKGALGILKVEGPKNEKLYPGKIREEIYNPAGQAKVEPKETQATTVAETKNDRIKAGQAVYNSTCSACHQLNGEGIPNAFPPLAKSDYLNADKIRVIKAVTGGLQGPITVNGHPFNGVMPAWALSDEDIANVLTYVYNSWGNSGGEISRADVKMHAIRK